MYVQYGCGFSAPAEWLSFDASLTLKLEQLPVVGKLATRNAQRFPPNVRQADIVKGLPVPDGSCRGVYASHVLEHLAFDDFHVALENTRKVLRAGGIFRLVVPDLEWAAREYLRRLEAGDAEANRFFLEETRLGTRSRARSVRAILHHSLGRSAHGWMWDALSLREALEEHGFSRIRRCYFGDCEDRQFSLVEDARRFEHAVAMEARVPQDEADPPLPTVLGNTRGCH
jgi:SAM-dependent methyltransferase